MNTAVSKSWRELSAEERGRFQAEADRMQRARVELMSEPLRCDEQKDGLRGSQMQRLNNARLDPSLRKISDHCAWQSGLGLGNHVCALKAEHVWSAKREEINDAFQGIFAYDGSVSANPALPAYQQPCCSTGGGVCRSSATFNHVDQLVRQLDATLAGAQLRQSVSLVRLTPLTEDDVETVAERLWFLVGCVGLRPLVHTVVSLMPAGLNQLAINVEQGRPKISTSHRLLWTALQRHTAAGRSAQDFSAEASWTDLIS